MRTRSSWALARRTLPPPASTTSDHRVVYNKATGEIFFDEDGNGEDAAVLLATVTANTALTASDFITV